MEAKECHMSFFITLTLIPLYINGLLLNWKFIILAMLAGQWTPWVFLFLAPLMLLLKHMEMPTFCRVNSKTGSNTCAASALKHYVIYPDTETMYFISEMRNCLWLLLSVCCVGLAWCKTAREYCLHLNSWPLTFTFITWWKYSTMLISKLLISFSSTTLM